MTNAIDVARYLIHKAAAEPEPEYLTPLRLQKLLYYVQGWCLAVRNRPLFAEKIEAWKHGPVVRDVYPYFAEHEGNEIFPIDQIPMPSIQSPDDQALIESVWESYKGYSANKLRRMTHSEPPWNAARRGLSPDAPCESEITHQSMTEFFSRTYEDQKAFNPELADLRAAAEEFRDGKGVPLEDALNEIGLGHATQSRTRKQGKTAIVGDAK